MFKTTDSVMLGAAVAFTVAGLIALGADLLAALKRDLDSRKGGAHGKE